MFENQTKICAEINAKNSSEATNFQENEMHNITLLHYVELLLTSCRLYEEDLARIVQLAYPTALKKN